MARCTTKGSMQHVGGNFMKPNKGSFSDKLHNSQMGFSTYFFV